MCASLIEIQQYISFHFRLISTLLSQYNTVETPLPLFFVCTSIELRVCVQHARYSAVCSVQCAKQSGCAYRTERQRDRETETGSEREIGYICKCSTFRARVSNREIFARQLAATYIFTITNIDAGFSHFLTCQNIDMQQQQHRRNKKKKQRTAKNRKRRRGKRMERICQSMRSVQLVKYDFLSSLFVCNKINII